MSDQKKSLGQTAHEAAEAYMVALHDPEGKYVTPWESLHKDDQGAMEAAAQAVRAETIEECSKLRDILSKAAEFTIAEPCREFPSGLIIQRRRQRSGAAKWSVNSGGNVLHADGTWELDPLPSGRTDEFLASTRFTLEEAWERANQVLARQTPEEKDAAE